MLEENWPHKRFSRFWSEVILTDRFDLLDTDYATLIATDYDPNLERLMRAAGESPRDAVVLTRLVGLAQKPLETEEDWQEFEAVWGKLEKNE